MAGIWYRQGTVALTQNSKRVTGTGTTWLDQAVGPTVGNTFWGPDNKPYEVERVVDNTNLDLVEAYTGATVTGAAYKIVTPEKFSVAALASQVAATLQYAQAQYANMSTWAASDLPVDVPVVLPDGVTSKNIPNLAKMVTATAAKLTETPQLKALDVPSTAFGRGRLNDADATAARAGLQLKKAAQVDITGPLNAPGASGLTGAIFERGSNANGEYVKFADGTMMCDGLVSYPTTGPVDGFLATYPAPFASVRGINASVTAFLSSASVTAAFIVEVQGVGASQCRVKPTRDVAGVLSAPTSQVTIAYRAYGRWL